MSNADYYLYVWLLIIMMLFCRARGKKLIFSMNNLFTTGLFKFLFWLFWLKCLGFARLPWESLIFVIVPIFFFLNKLTQGGLVQNNEKITNQDINMDKI